MSDNEENATKKDVKECLASAHRFVEMFNRFHECDVKWLRRDIDRMEGEISNTRRLVFILYCLLVLNFIYMLVN